MAGSGVRESAPYQAHGANHAPSTRPLGIPDSAPAPRTAPLAAISPGARKRSFPRLVAAFAASIVTFAFTLVLVIAPLAATIVAVWASWTAANALARLVTLTRSGQALSSPTTPTLLRTLDTAGRAGFLAIGYLALIFALITLMAGMIGRGWGRLFILPGVAFSTIALTLMGVGVMFATPLTKDLPLPASWLIPLAIYALIDAVLVSGVLVDARLTRSPSATGHHRAVRKPSNRATNRRRATQTPPHDASSAPA